MTIDEKEIQWWCDEYPELDREDIVWVLENIDGWDYNINTDKDD